MTGTLASNADHAERTRPRARSAQAPPTTSELPKRYSFNTAKLSQTWPDRGAADKFRVIQTAKQRPPTNLPMSNPHRQSTPHYRA
jgi:hypothetical protein